MKKLLEICLILIFVFVSGCTATKDANDVQISKGVIEKKQNHSNVNRQEKVEAKELKQFSFYASEDNQVNQNIIDDFLSNNGLGEESKPWGMIMFDSMPNNGWEEDDIQFVYGNNIEVYIFDEEEQNGVMNKFVTDYKYKDYMKFEQIELFNDDIIKNTHVEVVQSFANNEDNERDLKVFISMLNDDNVYHLEQVINVDYELGMAWDINKSLCTEDVNFDGEEDILINLGSFGNQGVNIYAVYLYNDGVYTIDENFFTIQNLAIDYDQELILAHWRNSAGSHGHGMYKIENGELVPYKILNIYWNEYEKEVDGERYFIDKYVVDVYENNQIVNEQVIMSDDYTKDELADMFQNESSEWGLYTGRWKSIVYNE